jgi:TM2 domain-containing membrane protein YozV
MPKKIIFLIYYPILIISLICSIWAIFSLKNYQDINNNQIPAFVIQQGKLSQKQIADLTKFDNAKNIWIISDKEDYNKATELIKQSADVISYANQVGRLDMASILLGIIAIIFGFVGIIGFLHIKEGVDVKTEFAISKKIKEIEKDTNERFEKLTKEYFEDGGKASKIIERYVVQENDKNNNEIEAENEEELN